MRTLIAWLAFASIAAAQSFTPAQQSASGSITTAGNGVDCTIAASCVALYAPSNVSLASIQLSGGFTATLQFETSVDGTTWTSLATTTGPGIYPFSLTGRSLRVRASSYASGPVTVAISTSAGVTETAVNYGSTLCGFGDSYMALNSTDAEWGPSILNSTILNSMGQFQFVHNGGVTGQTTAQILGRIQTDAIAPACNTVFVDGGSNDYSAGMSLAATEANLSSMYRQILAAGKRIILMTIPPRSGQITFNETLNTWIKEQSTLLNMPLVDTFASLVTPSTGLMSASCSADAIHPYYACVRLVGQAAVADLSRIFPPHHPLIPEDNSDPNNLISNGLMLNPGTGVPTGWSGSNTSGHATYTTSTNANILGNVLVATKTATSAGDNENASYTISSGLVPGHVYAFAGRFATSGAEAGSLVYQIGAQGYTAGWAANPLNQFPVYAFQSTDFPNGGQWYQEFTLPAGVTILQFVVNIQTGTGSVSVGQIGLYDLTALGITPQTT